MELVKDCEAVRQSLLGSKENVEDRKWTLIGQSFGGFVAVHYLSTQWVDVSACELWKKTMELRRWLDMAQSVQKVLKKVRFLDLCYEWKNFTKKTLLVFTTGGMPPLVDHPDDVYKALYGSPRPIPK